MIVTWTTLRSRRPVPAAPWQPRGASWWQAGRSGAGRAEAPPVDGVWWSVLATWPGLADAEAGFEQHEDLDAWHVVLEPASFRGEALLARGARPFDALPDIGRTVGVMAVVTFAGVASHSGREREFFRRFMHVGRDVARAPGHLAASYQAPDDGAVLTFSAWDDAGSAVDWAYAQPVHAAVIARQQVHRLVAASGFLRCAVLSSQGTLGDAPDPLAGRRGEVVRAGSRALGGRRGTPGGEQREPRASSSSLSRPAGQRGRSGDQRAVPSGRDRHIRAPARPARAPSPAGPRAPAVGR